MKYIGEWKIAFPVTPEECRTWKRIELYRALHMKVLCAAVTRIEGYWAAYIGVVEGKNHLREYGDVLLHGNKLPERIALAIFPEFEGVPYAD